jgi:hypothetical protein
MTNALRHFGIGVSTILLSTLGMFAQVANLNGPTPTSAPAVSPASSKPSGGADRFGIGVKVSLLGGGVEAAARVTNRTNVRAGFNMFSYSRGFNKDGIAYDGQIGFKTIEAHYDIFPFTGGFHVSPGVLVYAGTPISATASVPAGQSFSLGDVQYTSGNSTGQAAITGNGTIKFNRAAPMFTVGWGNLVSRKETKHFSIPVELGVAFQGSPKAALALAGTACDSAGCYDAATDPTFQSNVQSEQAKINNSMSFFKVYPIISVGFGYKF